MEEVDVQMLLQRFYPFPRLFWSNGLIFRQRLVKLGGGAKMSVFSVAQKYLPGELLGRVRMVKSGIRKRKTRSKRVAQEKENED